MKIFLFLFIAAAAALGAQDKKLTLENLSGRDFVELYLETSPPAQDRPDWLKKLGLPTWENERRIVIDDGGEGPWDVVAVDENGEEVRWGGVCAPWNSVVILRTFEGQPEYQLEEE